MPLPPDYGSCPACGQPLRNPAESDAWRLGLSLLARGASERLRTFVWMLVASGILRGR